MHGTINALIRVLCRSEDENSLSPPPSLSLALNVFSQSRSIRKQRRFIFFSPYPSTRYRFPTNNAHPSTVFYFFFFLRSFAKVPRAHKTVPKRTLVIRTLVSPSRPVDTDARDSLVTDLIRRTIIYFSSDIVRPSSKHNTVVLVLRPRRTQY